MSEEEIDAIVSNVPIVPAFLDDDGVLPVDWDSLDTVGLFAERGPYGCRFGDL